MVSYSFFLMVYFFIYSSNLNLAPHLGQVI